MAYERQKFGDGSTAGSGNVVADVSQHYGPFSGDGEQGVLNTAGGMNEAVVDFNGTGPLYDTQVIPINAIVTEIVEVNITGTVTAATVGAIDISAADGTQATYVDITTAGVLTVTGPTAGVVVVKYLHVL